MRANLDEMAEKAGVAKGTLYRYFESKADLYVAVLTNNYEIFLRQMEKAGEVGDTALDRMHSLATFYFAHWLEHPDYFQIFWAVDNESVIGDLPRDVIEKIGDFWEQNMNVTHAVLVAGVESGEFVECDTWEIATIIWTVADGLIESDNTKARRQIRRRPLEPLYMHAIETIMRGILTDPTRITIAPPAEPKKSTLVKM
jgi:AcrR family transcriptional regulator